MAGSRLPGGGVKVSNELQRRIPASFQLGLFAMVFGTLVAIPLGVVSAVKQDTWLDYGSRSPAIAMLALPSFFIATPVIAFGARWFDYSPPIFYKDFWDDPSANLQLVVIPAIILRFALSGALMRLPRAQMLEVSAGALSGDRTHRMGTGSGTPSPAQPSSFSPLA